jgi:hypothetical protein
MASEFEIDAILNDLEVLWPRAGRIGKHLREQAVSVLAEFDAQTLNDVVLTAASAGVSYRPNLPELAAGCRDALGMAPELSDDGHAKTCTCGRCTYGPVWDKVTAEGGWIDSSSTHHPRAGEPSGRHDEDRAELVVQIRALGGQIQAIQAERRMRLADDRDNPIPLHELFQPHIKAQMDAFNAGKDPSVPALEYAQAYGKGGPLEGMDAHGQGLQKAK